MHVSPFKQHEEYILLSAQVFDCRCPCADLTSQNIIKDLCHIFLTLNTNNISQLLKSSTDHITNMFSQMGIWEIKWTCTTVYNWSQTICQLIWSQVASRDIWLIHTVLTSLLQNKKTIFIRWHWGERLFWGYMREGSVLFWIVIYYLLMKLKLKWFRYMSRPVIHIHSLGGLSTAGLKLFRITLNVL